MCIRDRQPALPQSPARPTVGSFRLLTRCHWTTSYNVNVMSPTPPRSVALNDLLPQTTALQHELGASVNRVLASGWYILGRECAAFEGEFAAYCGVSHCI